MCSLGVEYSYTVAVTGSVDWLQAAEKSLVRLDGTVSQPNLAAWSPSVGFSGFRLQVSGVRTGGIGGGGRGEGVTEALTAEAGWAEGFGPRRR